ncbi:MAG: nitroreductase family protein [Deltaproteobacteria bacterium]|nr:nitroreductase family protein [Deltaproteobacteria bacterium]
MSPENRIPPISELLRNRRSVRRFRHRPVERGKILALLEAARIAPSACNRQDWHFIVIEDAEARAALVRDAGASRLLKEAPVAIACLYRNENMAEGFQSSSAAIENMLIEAGNQGLGALWLNSFGNEARCRKILGYPPEYFLTSIVLTGYPDEAPPPPSRKPIEEITHWGRFSEAPAYPLTHDADRWNLEQIRTHQRLECGKTIQGTPQDIFSPLEISEARSLFPLEGGTCLDLFSYDGHSSLEFFRPVKCLATFADLSEETSGYSRETLARTFPEASFLTFERLDPFPDGVFDNATLIFRIERLPEREYRRLFERIWRLLRSGGRFLVVFRISSSLYGALHRLLLASRGDNLRKTAVHSFFGPYRPVRPDTVARHARDAGFRVKIHRRFPVPPLLPEFFRLYQQYRRSGGRTYLHREVPENRFAGWMERRLGRDAGKESRFGTLGVAVLTKP